MKIYKSTNEKSCDRNQGSARIKVKQKRSILKGIEIKALINKTKKIQQERN